MKYLAILLTSLLASCASFEEIDRNNFTNFGITSRVEGREQFYMVDHDPIGFTDEKGKAERRIRWLEKYLSLNGLCKNGYEIVKEEKTVISKNRTERTVSGMCI
ncbi:MAG: hypothetical protein KBT63_00180 [Porticoccaceae bacterium]|nr:hypothetical protein [Porticoccaceae bacterium]